MRQDDVQNTEYVLPVSKQGYDSENTKLGPNITCFMAINLHAEIT